MSAAPLSSEAVQQTLDALRQAGSVVAAAKLLGLPRSTFHTRLETIRARKLAPEQETRPAATAASPDTTETFTHDQQDNAAVITSKSTTIRTLDDALKAARVDLKVWEVERHTVNKWDIARGTKGDRWDAMELWQVKVWLRRKVQEQALRSLATDLLADFRGVLRTPKIRKYAKRAPNECFILNTPDIHMGKRCWEKETGQSYGMDEAESLTRGTTESLIAQAAGRRIDQIILPVGNDLVHVDGSRRGTTAGTPQDMDGSWRQMCRRSTAMVRWQISRLEKIAPVRVVVVPGNHDADTIFHLGELLAAVYEGHPHVTVNNSPGPRLYEAYGLNVFGFAHYHRRPDELPALLKHEFKKQWAAARWSEFLLGHYHHRKLTIYRPLEDVEGVMVRICPAITSADHWHAVEGYVMAMRGGEANCYHHDGGIAAQFHANILPEAA